MPQLDGLRAAAITLVFVHHWTTLGHSLGIIGVQLFFVLSGFLITGILLRELDEIAAGRQSVGFSVRQFYVRRILRIFPLYYLCLLVFVILDRFGIRQTLPWFLFYLSNVYFCLRGDFSGPLSHLWSLAVEEQFYLIWPWAVLLTPRKCLSAVLLIMIALAPLTRAATFLLGHENFAQTSTMVWSNFDTLGMGALAALTLAGPTNRQCLLSKWLRRSILPCAVEAALARVLPANEIWLWLDPLAVGVLSTWVVWFASTGFEGIVGKFLTNPVVVYLGKISYGLYVWHMFAPAFLRNMLKSLHLGASLNLNPAGFFLNYVLTVAIASTSWFLVEAPINRLKRHFQYRKGQTTPTTGLAIVS